MSRDTVELRKQIEDQKNSMIDIRNKKPNENMGEIYQ